MPLTKKGLNNSALVIKITLLSGLFLLSLGLSAKADNVVQGFSAKETLQPGRVVALDSAGKMSVKAAPADNTNSIYGVVIDPSDAPITVVNENSRVFVATTGTYQVLASASGGSIKSGDYISLSNINGIAGKAQISQPVILGKAASSFDGKTNLISNDGGVSIGKIFVNITIQKNPLANTDPTLPYFLRKVTNSISNKSIPVIRVYTALIIFMVSLIAAIVILWSGVRSSLISLGRNPLSRHAIFSGMYKVVFTGLGVFLIGLAGVYLLLKV
jgi:hypothetical protein